MRVLLKLSGEVLKGAKESGICPVVCRKLAKGLLSLSQSGLQIGVVIGGGNIYRGSESVEVGMDRTAADYIGMLATLMNGVNLKHFFEEAGLNVDLFSGLECNAVAKKYQFLEARNQLEKGVVCIFVGGTGNPFFTTDSAASLRAAEIRADLLLKATKVDGVYTKDPNKYPDAKRYDKISYSQALEENLRVMDPTSFALCKETKMPMVVFSMDLLLNEEKITLDKIKQSGTHIF